MDTCSVWGDTVSQTNVLSFARINVVYLPELGVNPRPVSYAYADTHTHMHTHARTHAHTHTHTHTFNPNSAQLLDVKSWFKIKFMKVLYF